eukprot:TRINITY_DN9580_c0_g1_i1.p1 TRINITY_DN9580_c0_g1~~TRINITY_DN9580_c0_g1_i1.p1  ORF type:complete len:355 (+),score=52.61 TRINITY_DN9580_c0_g1_i1:148-1212(+)
MSQKVLGDPGEELQQSGKYERVKSLGAGGFGQVFLAKNVATEQLVAVKCLQRGSRITKYVEREIMNHRRLWHEHIIEYKELFLTQHYLCIVMEYASAGDMFHYVVSRMPHRRLPESEARQFFQQLVLAVDFCHRKGVVNRDIKLENALLCKVGSGVLLKLCDFGYSKHEDYDSAPSSRVGSLPYASPEVILARPGDQYDGKKTDIWSCGVMLYIMLVGAYPFERAEDSRQPKQKQQQIIQRIIKVDYKFPSEIRLSSDCLDLMSKVLVAEPNMRYSLQQIMEHRWFQTELPSGTMQFNDLMEQQALPTWAQSDQQVMEILQLARSEEQAQKSSVKKTTDEMLDEAMVEEELEIL